MSLQKFPELRSFLSANFAESDAEADLETAKTSAAIISADKIQKIISEIALFKSSPELVEALGMEANRWFTSEQEAIDWLQLLTGALSESSGKDSAAGDVVVKDSNGTPLAEGDAVTVIKDLKVKGGSSDLKRGTMIRKVHLIGDPENIECNVNGSTLVLKTCFLKKA